MVAAAKSLHLEGLWKSNPKYDDITLHNFLGMVPLDEDTGQQTEALLMDICAKIGLIEKDKNGNWVEGWDAGSKQTLVVGNVKTADNIDNFFKDIT